nr:glycerol-3-phosphate responsive antiterminator [Halanaerobium polyolivorans]
MRHLASYFKKYPVIPAVRDMELLEEAMGKKEAVIIFLLAGSIFDLKEAMELAHKNDKILMINIDLLKGIAHDKKGIEYLAENNLCDGIISTKSYLIKIAHKNDLMTIQRIFLLDSGSLTSAKKMLGDRSVDAVEILPAIAAPYFIKKSNQQKNHNYQIIAGGLVEEKEEIEYLVDKGVFAISTSRQELWNY